MWTEGKICLRIWCVAFFFLLLCFVFLCFVEFFVCVRVWFWGVFFVWDFFCLVFIITVNSMPCPIRVVSVGYHYMDTGSIFASTCVWGCGGGHSTENIGESKTLIHCNQILLECLQFLF